MATGAVVIFALAEVGHGSGFLAVYVAGLVVGNAAVRAHNAVVTFLDAATWLAQIGMFVVLGLLSWPDRRPQTLFPALGIALTLMLVARPAAVFLCLAPYRFSRREKAFMSWVGLCGAAGIFIASIPRSWWASRTPRSISTWLHRGAGLAYGAGLDHRAVRALAARLVPAQRPATWLERLSG